MIKPAKGSTHNTPKCASRENVWSCKDCVWIHSTRMTKRILEELIKNDKSIRREMLLEVRSSLIQESESSPWIVWWSLSIEIVRVFHGVSYWCQWPTLLLWRLANLPKGILQPRLLPPARLRRKSRLWVKMSPNVSLNFSLRIPETIVDEGGEYKVSFVFYLFELG